MIKKILDTIEKNMQQFSMEDSAFSYQTIKNKREELISLGMKIGCCFNEFESVVNNIETTEKFSRFSLARWGYYTPSILDDYRITNVQRPKRLYNKKLDAFNGMFYRYLYNSEQLVAIEHFSNDKWFRTAYFCKVKNTLYSFTFPNIYENQVYIYEAVYDERGNILTYSYIETYGMPENEDDEIVLRRCKRGIRAALLDFQKYHYDETGLLDYADDYKSIYDFSPQIVGLKLGKRFRFIYDDEGKRVGIKYDENAVPCVFDLD